MSGHLSKYRHSYIWSVYRNTAILISGLPIEIPPFLCLVCLSKYRHSYIWSVYRNTAILISGLPIEIPPFLCLVCLSKYRHSYIWSAYRNTTILMSGLPIEIQHAHLAPFVHAESQVIIIQRVVTPINPRINIPKQN